MNVNEYGVVLQFGVSFDMIAYTSLNFTFIKPDLTTLTVPGELGTMPVTTPVGVFAANTYATYTFVEGDVNQAGSWSTRLTYTDASPARLISTSKTFIVDE